MKQRSVLLLAAVVLSAVLLSSCSGTVRAGGTGTVTLYPTAAPLTGSVPVGRWVCYASFDYDDIKRTNRAIVPGLCYVHGSADRRVEYNADGTGWLLGAWQRGDGRIPDDGAFLIAGSSLVYARKAELRWALRDDSLIVQRRTELTGRVESVTDDVFVYSRGAPRRPVVMIRVGTAAHHGIVDLINCVTRNNARQLFELEECAAPPFTLP